MRRRNQIAAEVRIPGRRFYCGLAVPRGRIEDPFIVARMCYEVKGGGRG